MTINLFRQAPEAKGPKLNKYEKYGCTQNPFPRKPSVTMGSPDPRENGKIYLKEIREEEQRSFERQLIMSPERPQANSIAFLMDYATRRGRGIGKTAFLCHQCNRIMDDFGDELSHGSEVLFAIYVAPLPSGKSRRFSRLCKLLAHSMTEQKAISSAIWRLRAFSGAITDDVLDQVGNEPEKTIGDNKWLVSKGVDITFHLNHTIKKNLLSLGVNEDLASGLAEFGHSSVEFEHRYLNRLSNFAWEKNEGKLIFEDLVKVFKAAGFTNGLILIDEVEKIVTPQNSQERRSFTDSLRYFFIDGQCESAAFSFYRLLLTIHPYVQELLDPHWKAAGLDRFASLSGDLAKEYTIYFEPLKQKYAGPLAQTYLDASRIPKFTKGKLTPFDSDAIEEALVLSWKVPGIFLTILNNAVEKGLQLGWDKIRAGMIKEVAQARAPREPGVSDMITPLTEPKVNLKQGV